MRSHRPLVVGATLLVAASALALGHRPEEEVVQVRTTHPPSTTTTQAPTTTTTAPTTTTTIPPMTTTTAPPRAVVSHVQEPVAPCGGWLDLVTSLFPAEEVSTACRVLVCESGGNPTAENPRSSASGLWQFLDSTWTSTTGLPAPAAAYTPEEQTRAAATLWSAGGWGAWSCY